VTEYRRRKDQIAKKIGMVTSYAIPNTEEDRVYLSMYLDFGVNT
jgi:hypothetical protein